jgi:hypothetical protein
MFSIVILVRVHVLHCDTGTSTCSVFWQWHARKEKKDTALAQLRGRQRECYVVWKSNSNAWVTRTIFQNWFSLHFVPSVRQYWRRNNLSLTEVFLLDNAPGHPQSLPDFFCVLIRLAKFSLRISQSYFQAVCVCVSMYVCMYVRIYVHISYVAIRL